MKPLRCCARGCSAVAPLWGLPGKREPGKGVYCSKHLPRVEGKLAPRRVAPWSDKARLAAQGKRKV